MSRIVLVLLVILAVFSASSSGEQCGLNEEYKSCGSACEPTCDKPNLHFCTQQCVVGCQCKTGYVRNDNGSCVLPQNC